MCDDDAGHTLGLTELMKSLTYLNCKWLAPDTRRWGRNRDLIRHLAEKMGMTLSPAEAAEGTVGGVCSGKGRTGKRSLGGIA